MKYKIELTQNQLLVVIRAIELMMKTGFGQINELVEWIVTVRNHGDEFGENVETRKKDVADFLAISSAIEPFFKGVIQKNTPCRVTNELQTIYFAIRHYVWLEAKQCGICDNHPIEPKMFGYEPIPKIEKVVNAEDEVKDALCIKLGIFPDRGRSEHIFKFIDEGDCGDFTEWFKAEGKDSFQRWRCGIKDLSAPDQKGEAE